ncbi:hypothetical protein GOA67_10720 [Sinorhizobium meliloti]|nr:hypothetical protein [Sinorhizobium meliloti]
MRMKLNFVYRLLTASFSVASSCGVNAASINNPTNNLTKEITILEERVASAREKLTEELQLHGNDKQGPKILDRIAQWGNWANWPNMWQNWSNWANWGNW